ncbi:MAG: hypothetical protein REI96_12375 [Flavobacterium nitrogenifigens]|uniref:Uncharacterized protein n=1 Tax=Flavobacterium nitrogenifigens TaxID=1617283 RepID=A0A521AMS7_9FLAO|nr:hypothetical protein [Flavobacterium nitrogenifigens]KAF2339059.1 hypothetical protein DM397_01815 [Flavobacterium nitrogenifigens]MDQ8013240.1 hypothetical protein [Flavobacterium nitrogenifigens]SMO36116.1 hypothetical protein SAMN06265220_101297 [Flavobacterium nitrogenifigens]
MKKHILFLSVIVSTLITSCHNSASENLMTSDGIRKPKPPKAIGPPRILFIGNSHTEYYVSAPTLFQELCNANNQNVNIQQLVTMGVPLDKVYFTNKTEANQNFSNIDKDGNYYDYVIIQESTPIALTNLSKYRDNLKLFAQKIHKNSPDAAIYVYQNMSPLSYINSEYYNYYKELRKNTILAAAFIKNAGLLRVGDAVKDAYEGKNGYKYLTNNKDNLRDGKSTLHFINDGGFLQAVLLYATIFDKKPIIPKKLILSTGTGDNDCMRKQEVSKTVTDPVALEEIAFSNR